MALVALVMGVTADILAHLRLMGPARTGAAVLTVTPEVGPPMTEVARLMGPALEDMTVTPEVGPPMTEGVPTADTLARPTVALIAMIAMTQTVTVPQLTDQTSLPMSIHRLLSQ